MFYSCSPPGDDDNPLTNTTLRSSPIFHDEELIDLYLNHPHINQNQPLPVDYATIAQHQADDPALQALLLSNPEKHQHQGFPLENPQHQLICFRKQATDPWKIRIPDSLLAHTVNWYHMVLNHLGSKRLRQTIQLQMVHPHLSTYCEAAVRACRTCQQSKVIH